MKWQELTGVVLVGHSYGGMVISGVAEKMEKAIASLVMLDAFMPENGQGVIDIYPPPMREPVQAALRAGATTMPPRSAALFKVNEKDRAWVDAQCTPQPIQTVVQKLTLTGARDRIAKKTYIRAAGLREPAISTPASRARAPRTGAPMRCRAATTSCSTCRNGWPRYCGRLREGGRPSSPCKSRITVSAKMADAVADWRPSHPRALQPDLSVAPRPSFHRTRTVAWAAQRARCARRVKMDAIFVGIDVSKDRLDVHVCPSGEAFAVSRDGKGLQELIDRLRILAPQLIAIEATGGFETIAAAALAGAALPLAIVNPAQVRHFARAIGKRAKTDPIDAAVIARFAEAVKPEIRPLPDAQARLLGELVARRRQIVGMTVAERQREQRTAIARVRKSILRHIKMLEKELAEIDNDVGTLVRGSPAWRDKEDLLVSFPGIGNTLARTLLAEMPELGSLTRREIACLAGVAPFTRQSGRWKGKSMIAGGHAPVRTALYMAALSAITCNPPLKRFYQRLLSVGKPKMLALIAVARKILITLNAMLRERKQWQTA